MTCHIHFTNRSSYCGEFWRLPLLSLLSSILSIYIFLRLLLTTGNTDKDTCFMNVPMSSRISPSKVFDKIRDQLLITGRGVQNGLGGNKIRSPACAETDHFYCLEPPGSPCPQAMGIPGLPGSKNDKLLYWFYFTTFQNKIERFCDYFL